MTLKAIQEEIESKVDSLGSEIALALYDNILKLDDSIVLEYSFLIRQYTKHKIALHHINKRLSNDTWEYRYKTYNRALIERETMEFTIQGINVTKNRLRERLRERRIQYRIFHKTPEYELLSVFRRQAQSI